MKRFSFLALVLAIVMIAAVACADVLPKKVEVQLPAKAGGGTDVAGRQLVEFINKQGSSNFTIQNNTDGGGVVAFETVRTAKTNGSKILFFHTSLLIKYATGFYTENPSESFKVAAVGLPTEKGGYVLVVPAESGIKTVAEFIAACNEKNGDMRIGVETGSSTHIMSGIMAQKLNVALRYVDSGSDTEKLTNLVGGSIDAALVNANQARQYIEAEKVNAIACFSSTAEGGRCSILPDVPSFAEEGYDCVFGTYFYILLPKKASDEVAMAVHDLYAAATADEDTNAILVKTGLAMTIAPYEEGAALMAAQQESLVSVCAELGLAK